MVRGQNLVANRPMEGDQDGDAVIPIEFGEELHHLARRLRVERGDVRRRRSPWPPGPTNGPGRRAAAGHRTRVPPFAQAVCLRCRRQSAPPARVAARRRKAHGQAAPQTAAAQQADHPDLVESPTGGYQIELLERQSRSRRATRGVPAMMPACLAADQHAAAVGGDAKWGRWRRGLDLPNRGAEQGHHLTCADNDRYIIEGAGGVKRLLSRVISIALAIDCIPLVTKSAIRSL